MTASVVQNDVTPNDENSAVLQDLLRRVEGATGADRELDAAIWGLVLPGVTLTYDRCNFTASLDATLALAKGLGFYIRSEPRFHIDGERVDFISYALRPRWNDWRPDDEWFDRGEARHADQVLSALAALLRALIAEQAAGQSLAGKSVDGSSPQTPESPQ